MLEKKKKLGRQLCTSGIIMLIVLFRDFVCVCVCVLPLGCGREKKREEESEKDGGKKGKGTERSRRESGSFSFFTGLNTHLYIYYMLLYTAYTVPAKERKGSGAKRKPETALPPIVAVGRGGKSYSEPAS